MYTRHTYSRAGTAALTRHTIIEDVAGAPTGVLENLPHLFSSGTQQNHGDTPYFSTVSYNIWFRVGGNIERLIHLK